jgi:hypothetical protein
VTTLPLILAVSRRWKSFFSRNTSIEWSTSMCWNVKVIMESKRAISFIWTTYNRLPSKRQREFDDEISEGEAYRKEHTNSCNHRKININSLKWFIRLVATSLFLIILCVVFNLNSRKLIFSILLFELISCVCNKCSSFHSRKPLFPHDLSAQKPNAQL